MSSTAFAFALEQGPVPQDPVQLAGISGSPGAPARFCGVRHAAGRRSNDTAHCSLLRECDSASLLALVVVRYDLRVAALLHTYAPPLQHIYSI